MSNDDQEMTIKEAAAYLKVSTQYLYQSRHQKKGPKCEKKDMAGLGPGPRLRLVYMKSALDEWDSARREQKSKPKALKPKTSKKGRASQSS